VTAKALHEALDLLLAQYLAANPKGLPSTLTVLELVRWSYARVQAQKAAAS
jgi:hypothetical protein